ncbi:MAG: DinB family protein [Ignavibacteriae bacterium]|nr:DinB family protein [Ignavibacteriota bacterium]MCB0752000.1 DinB family protein [Ignavibacteriota bacterium]MCB9207001.1 DinB family protein [Ignavibacteriales bacterium]MCB9210510.1 DinB family protein [Ignavibacteriales bacterium]
MKKYFLDLFEYNNWANDKIILRLQELEFNFTLGNPILILSHIITSQEYWLERVKKKSSYNIYLWEEFSIQELGILSMNSTKEWIKFISKISDSKFQQMLEYKNLKGEDKSHTFQDIFQNVINHSNYHRGQINKILKLEKCEPVDIDFISYC